MKAFRRQRALSTAVAGHLAADDPAGAGVASVQGFERSVDLVERVLADQSAGELGRMARDIPRAIPICGWLAMPGNTCSSMALVVSLSSRSPTEV